MSGSDSGLENFILDIDQFESTNWEKAKRLQDGAESGLEKATQMFWAKLSALEFNRFDDIIEKVLSAHGFEVNLENILYCIENLKIGRKVEWQKNAASQKVRSYDTVVAFELPRKGRTGSLLQRFYGMIESLGHRAETHATAATPALEKALAKKLASLEAKNASLQADLFALRQQLGAQTLQRESLVNALQDFATSKFQSGAAKETSAGNQGGKVLPANWKLELCTVGGVDPDQQFVTIKVGKRVLQFAIDALFAAPGPQATGIALFVGDSLQSVFPIGDNWSAFGYEIAQVMAHLRKREGSWSIGKIKLKLCCGSELLFRYRLLEAPLQTDQPAESSLERTQVNNYLQTYCGLKRHDNVIVCFHEDTVFKLMEPVRCRTAQKIRALSSVHPELTEDKEKPTAVCAKKAHKGGFDAVNRVNSGWTLSSLQASLFQSEGSLAAEFDDSGREANLLR